MVAAGLFPDGSAWEYSCPFRREWVDCDEEEDLQLKGAYAQFMDAGAWEVEYLLHFIRFRADFRGMARTNTASGRRMGIRLRGGELPGAGLAEIAAAEGSAADHTPGNPMLAPDALVCAETGKPVPLEVRRAWGHGIPPEFTLAGEFDFTLAAPQERGQLGEKLSWHMMSAGVEPANLNVAFLTFRDRLGNVATGSRNAVQHMLDKDNNFPVHVTYKTATIFKGVAAGDLVGQEVVRTHMLAVKNCINELNGDINRVKHLHQRQQFERFILYLEDLKYQGGDDLSDAMSMEELCTKFPAASNHFALTYKTIGNLARVLRGEVDILEYLFGG